MYNYKALENHGSLEEKKLELLQDQTLNYNYGMTLVMIFQVCIFFRLINSWRLPLRFQ